MASIEWAVLGQIYEAVNLRYDMEIARGCPPVEARRLAMLTADYVTQAMPEHERIPTLLRIASALEQRRT